MQNGQSGLRGNGQGHLVAYLQAACAMKFLLVEELHAQTAQRLFVLPSLIEQEGIALQSFAPERVGDGLAAPLLGWPRRG